MVDSDRADYELPNDDIFSDIEAITSYRTIKRRRLHALPPDIDREAESDNSSDSHGSSVTPQKRKSKVGDDGDDDGAKERPKSKYKIHIPKNSDLPRDAFFTQPPQRSSSPYRIDDFHWKKPQKQIPPQLVKNRCATPKTGHVNPNPAPLQITDNNAVTRGTLPISGDSSDYGSPNEDDHYFDDVLDEMTDISMVQNNVNGSDHIFIDSQPEEPAQIIENRRLKAPLTNLKQTTLFGTQAPDVPDQISSGRKHNWPLANREEPPTHHKLELDALNTWIYPTNLGTIRDYQYSIVAKGLYHNLLVALPTGLGKTFIAATIMLNWFRWTTDAQIVFVAPTKPLVSQQVKACFEIAGIPRSVTSMLTGSTAPGLRAEEWNSKRIFFMTPQTIVNDLKTGICDPKRLVLLVVDEAHRATGNYAYVEVVKFVRRFNSSFRVVALTATPGSSIDTVQEVIDGLGISKVEIRTEESFDIRQYVHSRKIETILFENSDEMVVVMELFSKALQPLVNVLTATNAYWSRDPLSLTPYGCNLARQRWMSDVGKSTSGAEKGMVNTVFSLLASLSHGTELLKFHGIGPFYHKMLTFRNAIHADGKKGGKYTRMIDESEPFRTMMSRVQTWINTPDFLGHPKLEFLQTVVMNHFLDAGEGRGASDPSNTRTMVFAHYRDSAEEIARVLKRNEPMVRPHVFVGQATSQGSMGMDQKKQLDIIQKFKSGIYNTLVATSIGEEGLDIGEVDLIVCYDASASPIRMLQRMGRTGRKRAGNITVTLMKGKEEDNFTKAKDNYEKMQTEIASGARFNFRDDESRRIVPKGRQPIVDKRIIDIPLENTQVDLPEPKQKAGRRAPKRPPKKFHMPDGVRTGFTKASRLDDNGDSDDENMNRPARKRRRIQRLSSIQSPVSIPLLEEVLLTPGEERVFERRYLDIRGDEPQIVEAPHLGSFPEFQRMQRPTKHVAHGAFTKKTVRMLHAMHRMLEDPSERFNRHLLPNDRAAGKAQADYRAQSFRTPSKEFTPSGPSGDDLSLLSRDFQTDVESKNSRSNSFFTPAGRDESETNDDSSEVFDKCVEKANPNRTLSTAQMIGVEAVSDDELPDFSALIRSDEISRKPMRTRRRAKTSVVNNDSDDE